jgi:hypothetical protein
MEQLINLINEISSNDEMETVINAIKKKQKELKAELTLNALKSFEVGDVVLCNARDGVHEATITKINRTTADIEIGKDKYTAPLSILKPMEVAS